ncbi:hypothetical protein NQ317_010136 [Molorchus minor]|uniref:C2H2-type domain-containing protein n=1 Tax=Molorchus minor TaxID=1323400 RepID=A0ABQ9JN58_9CUCU|nr:hypothetical protein NQ317_010136 [Molorchus minor]
MSPSFFAVEGKKKRKSGPPLNCIECNFQTIHQVSLHCHIMAHQMGTLNIYSCSYCPYRISNKAQFNKHMKTHTEDDENLKFDEI